MSYCLFVQMSCVELSVFAYGLCRTVCFCRWLVSYCLYLQVAIVELFVCFYRWLVSNCLFLQMACVELSVLEIALSYWLSVFPDGL